MFAHRGQRIVARLRERTYEAALRQEVEFVEKGEGDVLSRLSADSSIVGERCVPDVHVYLCCCGLIHVDFSITQNLSDGLRAVIMSSVGRAYSFWV